MAEFVARLTGYYLLIALPFGCYWEIATGHVYIRLGQFFALVKTVISNWMFIALDGLLVDNRHVGIGLVMVQSGLVTETCFLLHRIQLASKVILISVTSNFAFNSYSLSRSNRQSTPVLQTADLLIATAPTIVCSFCTTVRRTLTRLHVE